MLFLFASEKNLLIHHIESCTSHIKHTSNQLANIVPHNILEQQDELFRLKDIIFHCKKLKEYYEYNRSLNETENLNNIEKNIEKILYQSHSYDSIDPMPKFLDLILKDLMCQQNQIQDAKSFKLYLFHIWAKLNYQNPKPNHAFLIKLNKISGNKLDQILEKNSMQIKSVGNIGYSTENISIENLKPKLNCKPQNLNIQYEFFFKNNKYIISMNENKRLSSIYINNIKLKKQKKSSNNMQISCFFSFLIFIPIILLLKYKKNKKITKLKKII